MTTKQANLIDKIFKDKQGKFVIWQNPNLLLWGWILFSLLGLVFKDGGLHGFFHNSGTALLFTWAYLEIRSGESIFRRVLGVIIMANIIYGFFR